MNLALSLIVHLLGAFLWIGGLLAMSRVLVVQAKNPGPSRQLLGWLAGRFNIFALLGAILTIGSGLYQLNLWGLQVFRKTRWMHHKLTFVILLIILHGVMWSTQRKWQAAGADAQLSRGRAAALHGLVGILLLLILSALFIGRLG